MLGGSSGINFMAYGRPCAHDLDDWLDHLGLKGWSWSELLPYFKRSERLQSETRLNLNQNLHVDEDDHGLDGPINTSLGPWQVPFEKDLLAAFVKVSGLSTPQKPYSGNHLGFYRSVFTIDRKVQPTRSYAVSGYLDDAAASRRPNLKVLNNALARRILFDDNSHVARGVEVLVRHEEGREELRESSYSIFASKEVILCAGAYQTPQLLQLSGIGNPDLLARHGIQCKVANPAVGTNLQEHTMSAVVYELASPALSLDRIMKDPALREEHERLYQKEHSGAFSGCISLTGYIPYRSQVSAAEFEDTINTIISPSDNQATTGSSSTSSSLEADHIFQEKQRRAIIARMRGDTTQSSSPDIQFVGTPATFNIARGYSNCSELLSGPPADASGSYSVTVSNMYPISRGNVHIQSTDALVQPLIDPGFLSHPADVDILAAGVAFADRVFKSPCLSALVGRRVDPPSDVDLEDSDQARQFVRDRIVSYHHALGTCAMGQVVDDRLRVKGVKSLRIVDASVLPMQLSTAIMATVYAMAEKAADLIKEDF